MLPSLPGPASKTIYINPDFNQVTTSSNGASTSRSLEAGLIPTAHINPLFVPTNKSPSIHMNPQFLLKKLMEQELLLQKLNQQSAHQLKVEHLEKNSYSEPLSDIALLTHRSSGHSPIFADENDGNLISQTRTRLVRTPLHKMSKSVFYSPNTIKPVPPVQPLLCLNRRKLVRRPAPPVLSISSVPAPSASTCLVNRKTEAGKITKFSSQPLATSTWSTQTKTFVGRYALRRAANNLFINRKISNLSTKTKTFKASLHSNMKLQLLNINGVLYKSTRNKLQRKDVANSRNSNKIIPPAATTAKQKSHFNRILFVHGTKFVMSEHGFKLTRVDPTASTAISLNKKFPLSIIRQRQRIDIGGLTYIASNTQNVFVRTRHHLARAHLNTAKQRSLQVLSKRLVKSNVPCPIFQRVGKCVAYERDRCNKLHDKLQVTICPRFLRNECHNSNCLLSHNVSLSKMPTCRFFLQGMCVRDDCPYLHKKLNKDAGICEDFLRGFCKLAEQCNKRHEFLCPEFERSGKCEKRNCAQCKTKNRQLQSKIHKQVRASTIETTEPNNSHELGKDLTPPTRYFIGTSEKVEKYESTTNGESDADGTHSNNGNDCDDTDTTTLPFTRGRRPKLGTLPAFIPLS